MLFHILILFLFASFILYNGEKASKGFKAMIDHSVAQLAIS